MRTESDTEITVHASGEKKVSINDFIYVRFSTSNCHLFDSDGQVFEKLSV